MKRIYFFIFYFLFLVGGVLAQDRNEIADTFDITQSRLALTTKHYGDEIVLRWAPKDVEFWFYGMKYGYTVARKDMSDVRNPYEVLVDTLRRWTEQEIESWFANHPEDEELALPMKTMYQDWENTYYEEGEGFADMLDKSAYFKQRHQMTLLGADMFPVVGDAAGLRYVDKNIDDDKLYSYRVTINYTSSDPGAYSISKRRKILERPMIFEAKEKEGHIVITWERVLHERMYTAYHVERSADRNSWERLTEHPYIQGISEDLVPGKYISYLDRVENYQPHYYRIIGIDPFGDMSDPSDAILAQGKDRTPPKVLKPKVSESEDGMASRITWSYPDMDEIAQAIIYKDNGADEELLYNATAAEGISFEVQDVNLQEGLTQYYLILVDTAGNYGRALPGEIYIQDETPPLPPVNLQAKPDTNGSVFLTWDQGPDRDVIGYYIFTAPRATDNFVKLNQKKYQYRVYEDTINMNLLTDKRYYKIAAIDKGGNIGDFSEILEVVLPDKIPPAPSLFYDYHVDSAGVFMGLMPSSSIDVVEHRLYRKLKDNPEWQLIQTFGKDVPEVFLDDKIVSNGEYLYKWVAVDEGGLESSAEHSTLNVKALDKRIFYRPGLRITKSEEGLELQVANDIPGDNYRIQIVRALGNRKFRTLTTLKDTLTFTDKIILKEGENPDVRYRAKILYRDGKRSKFGAEVTLK